MTRDQELEHKANMLKRLAFSIFCSEEDQYQQFMPEVQGNACCNFRIVNVCFVRMLGRLLKAVPEFFATKPSFALFSSAFVAHVSSGISLFDVLQPYI